VSLSHNPATTDTGTWKLNAKGFCTTWQHSKPNCFTFQRARTNGWFKKLQPQSQSQWPCGPNSHLTDPSCSTPATAWLLRRRIVTASATRPDGASRLAVEIEQGIAVERRSPPACGQDRRNGAAVSLSASLAQPVAGGDLYMLFRGPISSHTPSNLISAFALSQCFARSISGHKL
jgi:hypothetical protein